MSATVLQYPPSSPKSSYLASPGGGNKRESIASTSAASYETALASAVPSASDSAANINSLYASSSSSSEAIFAAGVGDETIGPQPSPATKVNPLHVLATSQSDGAAAPIHITRVSGDTVYVKQDSSASRNPASARVHRAGKALSESLDNGRQKVVNMVLPSSNVANGISDGLRTGGNVAGAPAVHHPSSPARGASAVEGPNGLTPPPSPPSTEEFGSAGHTSALAGTGAIFGGPTFEEPTVVETTVSPSTPTKTAMTGSPSPMSTPRGNRDQYGTDGQHSLTSQNSLSTFSYPRVNAKASSPSPSPQPAPPSSYFPPTLGLSSSLPTPSSSHFPDRSSIHTTGSQISPPPPTNGPLPPTSSTSDPTYIAGLSPPQAHLHPSSASLATSAHSSTTAGLSPYKHASAPSPERRNTTTYSAASPSHTPGGAGHNRSRSLTYSTSNALSPERSRSRDANGVAKASLDSDIEKEAEQIRKERNSKRAREIRERERERAEAEARLTGIPAPVLQHRRTSSGQKDREREMSPATAQAHPHDDPTSASATEDEPGVTSGVVVPNPSGTLDDVGPAALSPAATTAAAPPPFPHPMPFVDGHSVTLVDGGPVPHTKEKEKEQDQVLVGNLIGEDHVNYVLMYNMLTGIRIGVSRCEAKIKRPLTPEDYTASHKFSFDIVGNELTPSAKYDFKFKDYAPWVFRTLREEHFYLDPADYLLSLTSKYILSELGSPGKSGSFFYFSRDYRFIIKTIHHNEHKFLRRILPLYHAHVKENPHTLLSRFYGLHRVKLPRGRKIHFVIMNNLFPPHRDIHETYDLKGSTVGREYPEPKAQENPRAVLKDLNWINRHKVLELGPEKAALLTEQLRRDSEFLKQVNVMDYSLLIGIHNMQRGNRDNLRRNTLKVFKPDMMNQLPAGARRRRGSASGRAESTDNVPRHRGSRGAPGVSNVQSSSSSTGGPVAIASSTSADHHHHHPHVHHHQAAQSHVPQGAIGSLSNELPGLDDSDRQHFIFYQDEGGYRATDDSNRPMDTIYYLGVIDITTPYNAIKKAEHFWKGMRADAHKISPVPAAEYASRFFSFLTSSMRGGGGTERFKAE